MQEVAEAPELAYSATLLIALRDALPYLGQLIEVLREIRDRMPGQPIRFVGEPLAEAPAILIKEDGVIDIGADSAEGVW